VSIPAMRSFPEALGRGLDIRQGVQVGKLSFRDDVFYAETANTSSKDIPISDELSGPFDAVLLTAPGPQTADLIEGLLPIGSDLLKAARKVTYTPQFSVLVGYDFLRDAPSIIHNPTSKIAKIVNQAKKPDRPEKSAFVVFCSPEWSLENLDKPKGEVAEIILKDLENILSEHGVVVDGLGEPAYLAAHSWRYCRLENPAGLSPEAQIDSTSTLAVAGDWIMLPDTHGALSSGINAARQIETKLSNRS
jgi:renalase